MILFWQHEMASSFVINICVKQELENEIIYKEENVHSSSRSSYFSSKCFLRLLTFRIRKYLLKSPFKISQVTNFSPV